MRAMSERTTPGTDLDRMVSFTIPDRDARGRVVRLGAVLHKILAAHAYEPSIKRLLAEALVVTALLGGLLKRAGSQLTLQAQTEGGIVELMVCDYRDGELRGYVKHDVERLALIGPDPSLSELFGKGYLAITFDVAEADQRYQGVVPLEGETLAEAVETYFEQSEQVPTLIRSAVRVAAGRCLAGGILLQHLADAEEGRDRIHARIVRPEWEHVAILGHSVQAEELLDPQLSAEGLIWRLFNEEREVRVQGAAPLTRGCRCSIVHFEEVLARFPKEDRREMRDEQGIIRVDCAFCSREFPIQD
jgi:molecular chaperone Hsp33